MKILIVVDRPKSAISILAVDQQKYTPHHDIAICPVHPKRPGDDQLAMADTFGRDADVVHVGYWRSGEVLRQFPWFDRKPKILVHHNPYDLHKGDWSEYDAVVVKNKTQKRALPGARLIPHCIDFETFTWEDERDDPDPAVGMVAGRIESSKGIVPVAQACGDLGYRFLLVGRLPGKYIREVEKAAQGKLDFRQDVTAHGLVEAYHEMRVLVVNSKDDFETGPMPILEAMATGTPVLTRNVGMVPDIYDGDNLMLRAGKPGDVDGLKDALEILMNDKALRDKLRNAGFRTAAGRASQFAARTYSELYHEVAYPATPLVSVIVPTCDRADTLPRVLGSVEAQTYPHIEVVVCDDSGVDHVYTKREILEFRKHSRHTVKYVATGKQSNAYGLAAARNLGVVEAEGEYLVFLDDRLAMEPEAVQRFVFVLRNESRRWVWGVKDGRAKGFVENFSAVRRVFVVNGGMFCEQMRWYGGMTRETHKRFSRQGVTFVRVDEARAHQIRSSRGWKGRRDDLVRSRLLLHKMYGG